MRTESTRLESKMRNFKKVFDTEKYLARMAASSVMSHEEKLFNNLNLSICVGTR
jgi:hypothetical protein